MSVFLRRAYAGRRAAQHTVKWHPSRSYATPTPGTKVELPETASKVARIESRVPRFLRRFVTPLRTAPLSHITAFIILHEITAIVPLFGLAAAFHYSNWLPPYISEGKWVSQGVEMFGSWLRKRGWISDANARGRWWARGETGTRVVVELATAYAIIKALLPLRLIFSVWMTPWFATWTVLPFTSRISRLFRRKNVAPAKPSGAAGTGATGGATLPKD